MLRFSKFTHLLLLCTLFSPALNLNPLMADSEADSTRSDFNFNRFVTLKSNDRFAVTITDHDSKRVIGSGRILVLEPEKLTFEFELQSGILQFSGRLELSYSSRSKKYHLIRLNYRGNSNGKSERSEEVVKADPFLVENNILTFRYLARKRFIQLSINSQQQTSFVTEYGRALITPLAGSK